MNNRQRYPENWSDEIRPSILKRDNYRCQRCNVKHRQYIFIDQNNKRIVVDRQEHEELKREGLKTFRIYLQVAHLNHNPQDNDPSNLLSLCPTCHHENDKEHKRLMKLSNKAVVKSIQLSIDDAIRAVS